MSGIFISYRRDDTSYIAGRLHDRLAAHFGRENIFRDVDTVRPGVDFVKRIDEAVGSCNAFLVMIGDGWLKATDAAGRQRLSDPEDWVRLEIEAALQREILIVPLLVEDAPMPPRSALPASLRPLVRYNAMELSDKRWDYEVDRLIGVVSEVVESGGSASAASERLPHPPALGHAQPLRRPELQPLPRLSGGMWAPAPPPHSRRTGVTGSPVASTGPSRIKVGVLTGMAALVLGIGGVTAYAVSSDEGGPPPPARTIPSVPSGEFLIPSGQRATFTGAAVGGCNRLAYGYQLSGGPFTAMGRASGSCSVDPVPDVAIGPFPTAVAFVLVLQDESCDRRFDSKGSHARVSGTNPYRVDIADSGGSCESADDELAPGRSGGNLRATVAIG